MTSITIELTADEIGIARTVAGKPESPWSSYEESVTHTLMGKIAKAAPIYAGSPGYGTHLDRDEDGVACE